MSETNKVTWLDWLRAELGPDVDTDLGQELVRCVGSYDQKPHPSYVDMAVYKSFLMSERLPATIQALAAHQARERLRVGPKGHFSPAAREEARKMAMTTMTSFVAAGLGPAEAALSTAKALISIYGRAPYVASVIRRNYKTYRESAEGIALLEILTKSFAENPPGKAALLSEINLLGHVEAGVYN